MEQANRLTLRSVSRPAPAGLGISNLDFTLFDRNTSDTASTSPRIVWNMDTSGAVRRLRAQLSAASTTA
jgi:hypothetical protein